MLFNNKIKQLLLVSISTMSVLAATSLSARDSISVENCEQLEDIGKSVNALSADYIQVADIDCQNAHDFEPIGHAFAPFTGTYDGQGFEISGLNIRHEYQVGLFGYVSHAIIVNVNVIDYEIVGEMIVGGLIGLAEHAHIQNCAVSGTLKSRESYAGGLIGLASYSKIHSSDSTAHVSATEANTGGLIGGAYDSVINESFASGDVVGDFAVGGLIGHLTSSTLDNSYATGSVTGDEPVGGLIGLVNSGVIQDTYATGLIKGRDAFKGGLIGAFALNSSKEVYASYWDEDTSGQDHSAAGEGRSTEQMQLLDLSNPTYVDWDSDIWLFEVGEYPVLQQ